MSEIKNFQNFQNFFTKIKFLITTTSPKSKPGSTKTAKNPIPLPKISRKIKKL